MNKSHIGLIPRSVPEQSTVSNDDVIWPERKKEMGRIQIKQFDRLTVQFIRQRLQASYNQLAEELNIMIELGSCSIRTSTCRFQLNLAVLDSKGKPVVPEVEAFKHNAILFGFEDADLGKEFSVSGQTYTITGFSPKSQKSPVIAKSSNGKINQFACRAVLEAMGRKVPSWVN